MLHPVDKGGKIRTYNMLKEMKRDHEIVYLTLDDGAAGKDEREQAAEYCHELICVPWRQRPKFSAGFYAELAVNLVSKLPYAISKYESAELRRRIQELTAAQQCDVVVCDFLAPAVNMPARLSCPTVLFQHNVEAMIWQRHYEMQNSPLQKAYLWAQWRKMRAYERQTCREFDCVVAVSTEDRVQMQAEYSLNSVFAVPTGVDTEFFRPQAEELIDPHNLVFTGSMDWLPNEDAIRYFTEQIMPRIKQTIPDLTLTVVGRNPYPALLELSKRDPSVVVTGRVDDVRPYMDRAAAYVVPLRIGGGTRLKIYEAMAMEKAIVSTSIGAEGLPVKSGDEIMLADDPTSFANAVVEVLSDSEGARAMGRRAAKRVRDQFGWTTVAEQFAEICGQAAKGGRMKATSRSTGEADSLRVTGFADPESVSVVIPCYNEERFIGAALTQLAGQYDEDRFEIIVVDGLSQDQTRAVIGQFKLSSPNLTLTLIDNPSRNISTALNLGVAAARGNIIARMDAHAAPSAGYIRRCVEVLRQDRAAVVGMPCNVRASAGTLTARAIAGAVSHPFGIGDATYRLREGGLPQESVDTVAFACFKKSLWTDLGGFNESLLTNEDYDFNYRARQSGRLVILDRSGHCDYFARATLNGLVSQYLRYGRWKAQMIKLHPRSIKLRHLVAPVFVCSLILLGGVGVWWHSVWWLLVSELLIYFLLAVVFGARVAQKAAGGFGMLLLMPIVFLAIHLSWGSSFLLGLVTRPTK